MARAAAKTARARGWQSGAVTAAKAAGLAAGGAALTSLGLAYYVAHALTAPRRPGPTDEYLLTPFETGATYEAVTFPSADAGITLHGWWFPRPETDRVVVGCPGYRGTKSDLIGISTALWRAGFNVLIFDFHGHGAGHNSPVTLAYREVRDFFGALDYVERRAPGARVGVIGFSMGASIAVMGSARRPQVRTVVADSPFTTHEEIVAHAIRRVVHIPGEPVARLADRFIERRAGYRHRDVRPIGEVAAIAPRPLLLIHGTADDVIPVSHAYRMYEAAGAPKELWIGEGAAHCGTYFLDRATYCERVTRFFERALGTERTAAAGSVGTDATRK